MTSSPKSARGAIASRLVFSLLVLALAAGIFLYRQWIIDQFNLWQYKPTQDIAQIAERAELNDRGKFYFYTSRPAVEDRAAFNQSCNTGHDEETAVLGCYAGQRIYLFNVTDEQLDGIKEVTAAHEMLHAAYDRLSAGEREHVDELLETEAAKITDPDFIALMKAYNKAEPGERLNELHSIIGTQIKAISPDLASYYGQYFKNRTALVTLYTKYEAVFQGIKDQQTQIVNELNKLVTQINTATEAYNTGAAKLESDIKSFNTRAENGGFSSQSEFQTERAALVARQQQLGSDRTLIDGYIATYNTKRQQLIAINGQAEALNRSINSNLTPLPSI